VTSLAAAGISICFGFYVMAFTFWGRSFYFFILSYHLIEENCLWKGGVNPAGYRLLEEIIILSGSAPPFVSLSTWLWGYPWLDFCFKESGTPAVLFTWEFFAVSFWISRRESICSVFDLTPWGACVFCETLFFLLVWSDSPPLTHLQHPATS